MTELEARANALTQLAADYRGYAMNWPGRLVAVAWPPTGAALVFVVMDPAEPSFTTVRALDEDWPQPMPCRKVMLEASRVRCRWLDYRESDLFVYSLTGAEYDGFLALCSSWRAAARAGF